VWRHDRVLPVADLTAESLLVGERSQLPSSNAKNRIDGSMSVNAVNNN
jgi:hypothetical protein